MVMCFTKRKESKFPLLLFAIFPLLFFSNSLKRLLLKKGLIEYLEIISVCTFSSCSLLSVVSILLLLNTLMHPPTLLKQKSNSCYWFFFWVQYISKTRKNEKQMDWFVPAPPPLLTQQEQEQKLLLLVVRKLRRIRLHRKTFKLRSRIW